MPFLPAFLLMAQAGPNEVVLHYRRPSALVADVRGVSATLTAFDDRGTVGIAGSPKEVAEARQYLALVDTPRKPLLIRLTVASPVDHLTWEVDARLVSGQKWRTADDETGSEIALEPRIDASGTLVLKLVARCGQGEITSLIRLPKGQSRTLELGTKNVEYVEVGPEEKVTVKRGKVPLPSITVRYVGG